MSHESLPNVCSPIKSESGRSSRFLSILIDIVTFEHFSNWKLRICFHSHVITFSDSNFRATKKNLVFSQLANSPRFFETSDYFPAVSYIKKTKNREKITEIHNENGKPSVFSRAAQGQVRIGRLGLRKIR